jgi:hypothetical protein
MVDTQLCSYGGQENHAVVAERKTMQFWWTGKPCSCGGKENHAVLVDRAHVWLEINCPAGVVPSVPGGVFGLIRNFALVEAT